MHVTREKGSNNKYLKMPLISPQNTMIFQL